MSVEALAVVLHHSRSTGTAKLVLLGIANHEGDGGSWPSIATLARYANVEPRTVQRAVDDLVAAGEVQVGRNDGGTRQTPPHLRPNLYRVLVGCPPDCDGTAQHRPRRGVTPTSPPDAHVTGGVTPTSGGGVTPTSPEPSLEPPMNSGVAVQTSTTDRARPAAPSDGPFPRPLSAEAVATLRHREEHARQKELALLASDRRAAARQAGTTP